MSTEDYKDECPDCGYCQDDCECDTCYECDRPNEDCECGHDDESEEDN